MKNKLIKFIEENAIDLYTKGGNLNGQCCILSGFALHFGYTEADILIQDLVDNRIDGAQDSEVQNELCRVFEYAKKNNYEAYWDTNEAHVNYNF
jgi:hypothetical protein